MHERNESRLYSLGRFLLSPAQLAKDIREEGNPRKAVFFATSWGMLNGLLIGILVSEGGFRATPYVVFLWGLQCMYVDVLRMNRDNNRQQQLFLESLQNLSANQPSSSGDLSETVELGVPPNVQEKSRLN